MGRSRVPAAPDADPDPWIRPDAAHGLRAVARLRDQPEGTSDATPAHWRPTRHTRDAPRRLQNGLERQPAQHRIADMALEGRDNPVLGVGVACHALLLSCSPALLLSCSPLRRCEALARGAQPSI